MFSTGIAKPPQRLETVLASGNYAHVAPTKAAANLLDASNFLELVLFVLLKKTNKKNKKNKGNHEES